MKLFTSICAIAATAMTMFVTSCNTNNTPTQERANTSIDSCLYGVEYDDYDFDGCAKLFEKRFLSKPASCSEVRNGNFVGRNLDWYINTDASAVIRVNAKQGDTFGTTRYASIGVVGSCSQFSDSLASTGEYNDVYQVLPLATVDGINEHGVYAGVNVTATGETSFDKTTWEPHAYGHGAAMTNPKSDKKFSVTYLVRVILDHASSVADAKELIKSINWYEPQGFPTAGQSQAFHWLISDSISSCVVEFLDNKVYFNDAPSITEPSFGTIMTNFNNTLLNPDYAQTPIYQHFGAGYERWDILAKNYKSVNSAETMQKLMSRVWYTTAYTKDIDDPEFLHTEYATDTYSAEDMYLNHEKMLADPAYREFLEGAKAKFNDKSLWHVANSPLWYSTHTSVYDISARQLHLLVHEGLDGMKQTYVANFDTHFAKPLEMQK